MRLSVGTVIFNLPGMIRYLLIALLTMPPICVAVQMGDTKQQVLDELGKPKNTMGVGNQEFFTYEQGRIAFTDGKVSAMRGQFIAVEPKPEPQKVVEATPEPVAKPAQPKAHWYTDFNEALEAASEEDKRVLALFTGSDWCPPCQKFEAEVAHDEQFAGIFSGDFVFFKCDWLRNTPQPPAVSAEVDRLRREYGISRYPTLKILDDQGDELDEVDWTSVRGGTFKEAMIEAIDDSRKATEGGKKASSWWPF